MSIDDGGPAFPNLSENTPDYPIYDGMSLRDWFAGMALQGQLASSSHPDCVVAKGELADERKVTMQELEAFGAYKMADAMLAQRKVEPDGDKPTT